MSTIGKLAKKHGLSRSTLLYYDRIGLLRPTGHVDGQYRHYSAAEDLRLAKICEYRKAGLKLKEIARLLEHPAESSASRALEERLKQLNQEMVALREQQELVATLLGRSELLTRHRKLDKATWVNLLSEAGFSEEQMRQWHIQFERSAPEKHRDFLQRLAIPESEILAIRAMAAAPQEVLKINNDSGKFMEMFFTIYEGLEREGPGSFETTARAYGLCQGLPPKPRILELGCGSGGATIPLAQVSGGRILATEIYQPYLDRLIERVGEAGLEGRVEARRMDMGALDCEPETFDLIWCEGAAYILGVDKALAYWKPYLKAGGCLVFSDAVWLVESGIPDELEQFWAEGYPAMRTARENVAAAESLGYTSLGHFTIDHQCWLDYYADVERHLVQVEATHGQDPNAQAIIAMARKEERLFQAHGQLYGYEMHVLRS